MTTTTNDYWFFFLCYTGSYGITVNIGYAKKFLILIVIILTTTPLICCLQILQVSYPTFCAACEKWKKLYAWKIYTRSPLYPTPWISISGFPSPFAPAQSICFLAPPFAPQFSYSISSWKFKNYCWYFCFGAK